MAHIRPPPVIGKGAVKTRTAWWWMVVAVLAPAAPTLLDVPYAFVSLVDGLGSTARDAGNTAAPQFSAEVSTAVAVRVPDPLTQWFTRVTASGLPIVAPAVAFLVPRRFRRPALITAGIVLGVLVFAAIAVTQTAQTGDAVRAGVLGACYAGSIAAMVRAYRLTVAEPAEEGT